MKLKLLLLFILFFSLSAVHAQSQIDTTSNSEETTISIDEEDADTTASDTINHALNIFDFSKVPAAHLYNSWNNLFVNPYDTDLVKKPDTTIISLAGFVLPFRNYTTSDFGWRRWQWHYGTDIKLRTGDSIRSSFDGMVRVAKRSRSYGNYIVIRHHNGLETVYGHMSKLLVVVNQYVAAGQIIGLGGNTGHSTGPHLHYEIRFLGNNINPHDVVNFETGTAVKDTLFLCQENFNYISEIRKIRFHVIRSGDNLGKIARRYGVSISKLCALNRISRKTILRIGRRLRYT